MSERLAFNYGTVGGLPPRGEEPPAAEPAIEHREPPRDWAFLGLMAFTAVLFFRPQDAIPILAPLHLAELTALTALAALVWGRMSRGLAVTRIVPELIGVLLLGGVILATAPFSVWMGGAIGTFTDLYLKVVLIFILMINTLTTPKRIEQFTWMIVIATGYIAFRAVLDYARGVNLIENGRVQGAVGGIFKNPNDLALNLVAIMPLAASLALRSGPTIRRLFAASVVLAMIGATVATGSRSGAVGLVLMAIFLAARMVRRYPGVVFAGVVAVMLSVPFLPDSYLQRVSSITDPSLDDTGSREARRILLREAFAAFVANPLTGVGAGQFKNYDPEGREEAWRETHNVVLQVASELGIVGLAAFLFLVARGFMAPMQTRRLLRRATGEIRSRGPGGAASPARQGPVDRAVVTDAERESIDSLQTAISASMAGWFTCALFASVAYHWTFYYVLALAIAPREVLTDRLEGGSRSRLAARRRMVAVEARA